MVIVPFSLQAGDSSCRLQGGDSSFQSTSWGSVLFRFFRSKKNCGSVPGSVPFSLQAGNSSFQFTRWESVPFSLQGGDQFFSKQVVDQFLDRFLSVYEVGIVPFSLSKQSFQPTIAELSTASSVHWYCTYRSTITEQILKPIGWNFSAAFVELVTALQSLKSR